MNEIFEINRISNNTLYVMNNMLKGNFSRKSNRKTIAPNLYDVTVSFVPVLYKYNESYVEYKSISFLHSDKNFTEYFKGIESFVGERWKKVRERYKNNVLRFKMEQVAYGASGIKKFIQNNQVRKVIFFYLDPFIAREKNEYVDYHLASQLSENVVEFNDENGDENE